MRIFFLFLLWWNACSVLQAQQMPLSPQANDIAGAMPDKNRSQNEAVASGVEAEALTRGYRYRRVWCDPLPSSRARAVLEAEGVRFISYISRSTYLVALPEGFDEKRLSLVNARRVWVPLPEEKMNANLKEKPYGAWAVDGEHIHLYVQVYPQVRLSEVAVHLRALGYDVVEEGNQNGFLHLRVRQADLVAVAALPFVRYLELLPPPPAPEDVNGRSLHRAGLLDMDSPIGRKYDGTGVSVVVRDDGPLGPHIDFQGRYTDWFSGDDGFNGTHGDGVAGILGGAGNLNPRMRGMAAGTHIYTLRYRASFQDATLALHTDRNATLTNTSYSDGCNAGYTLSAQTVENQLFQFPTLMHVFSAGNDGSSNCNYGAGPGWGNITGGHKVAKNAIAVANLRADGTLMTTSSRGPVHDGRLKPDLAAHGQGQGSTSHNNTYQTFGGTSAAAPGVAGVMAQLTQAYREHFNGEEPPAALLKAALLNTANDLGNPGPDFQFGFGLVNAWRAYRLLTEKRWLRAQTDHQAVSSHTLTIPPNVRQARILLYWADPPAEAGTTRALINDLDLQVSGPDGTTYQPWILDPTPNATALNAPAKPGRDSLNNVEQVALTDPAPGDYLVHVQGFEVPLGPQSYYLTWEFLYDSLKLVYPAGGEGLAPGDTCRIQWDAFGTAEPFLLHYSLDDGQTWLPIEALNGDRRMHDWRVPDVISHQVRVRVSRGAQSDMSEFPVSIVGVPANVKVERVCLDSVTLSWTPMNDTLQYDVYVLGEKYMEIATTSAMPRATLPITNTGQELWFSVRASTPFGLAGRRAVAVSWSGGLLECAQPHDLALREWLSPTKAEIESQIACGPTTWPVQVRVANEGTLPAAGALIHYQLNDRSPITEPLPELAPGQSLDFTFSTPLTLAENGQYQLRVWTTFAPETFFFNDTLTLRFQAVVEPKGVYFTENFDGPAFPPPGWAVINPDNEITWRRFSSTVTGPDGQLTSAVFMNFFSYPADNQEDYLYLPPVDLGQLPDARLVFYWAYALYSSEFSDSLRVEAFPDCDLSASPIVLWARGGTSLATRPQATNAFSPTSASHWRQASIPLDDFKGRVVILRFTGVNDYGNNLFLDNIGIVESDTSTPRAMIFASADTLCRVVDTVRFWTAPANANHTYRWTFGTGAQPAASATGPGPHDVRFMVPGLRQVQLIVSNASRADTATYPVFVFGTASANFSWAANQATVTFTNTSTMAETYEWDFGDGSSSTAINPTHTYALPGQYEVVLRARNRCSMTPAVRVQTIPLDFVSTREPEEVAFAWVVPNPNAGAFAFQVSLRQAVEAHVGLLDAQGRLLEVRKEAFAAGVNAVVFERVLPAGVYLLRFQTPTGVLTRRVVVSP